MYAHNGADISSKISPASSDGQIFNWIETICVDHEVPVILVDGGGLASISIVEEFWKCLPFDIVDFNHIKPGAITWENDRVSL